MKESLNLSQELRQQQTLAPMQLQYVKMLEMNAPEVEDEVQRALDENPALESDDNDLALPDADSAAFRYSARQNSESSSYYEPVDSYSGQSLLEHLSDQLAQTRNLTPKQHEIAKFIIGNIDHNGYLTRSLRFIADDIAISAGIDATDEEVREVWKTIRTLEPAGVGASDLRDSLLLQLVRLKDSRAVRNATEIIRNYFDVFSLMHYKQLQSMLGITEGELREAVDVIRSLNPKPGAQIGNSFEDSTNQITPDFLVETDPNGALSLTLLNRLPQLHLSQSFTADTPVGRKNPSTDSANAFIRQRRDEAASFIKALSLRQATLFRVMSAIMQWQRDFFLTNNPATLRPMILRDISDKTGDDISVISRATAGKYVATVHGVYPLKFFFNEAREGDEASSPTVMARLREIIDSEDKSNPLTDQALTDMLAAEGINIARRTVAKYRERMGLPVGRLRKQITG